MSKIELQLHALVVTEQERDHIIDGLTLLVSNYERLEKESKQDGELYGRLKKSAEKCRENVCKSTPVDLRKILINVLSDTEERP